MAKRVVLIKHFVEQFMATLDELAYAARCYRCVPEGSKKDVELYLLSSILLALDPMADTSIDALMLGAKCFRCIPEGSKTDIALYLLSGIYDAGGPGGGGSQQIYFGASPPAAPDDPSIPAIWYPTAGGQQQTWTGSAWA